MAKEWFREWFSSAFYHQLYFEHDEKEAMQFILKLIDFLKPSLASKMLDVACGRGRHAKCLASQGFDVTGIDLSFENIEYARQFESDKLHFFQHDMRLPAWINYFDYAFNFFTAFGYFNTRREHDDAIRMIANSLKPAGVLVLDYLNVHYVEDHFIPAEIKKIGSAEYHIQRWQDETHFYKKMIIVDPSSEKSVEFTEKVAKLSLGDFTDMLSFQKMQVTDVFGDYSLASYDVRKTPRMIIIAKKTLRN